MTKTGGMQNRDCQNRDSGWQKLLRRSFCDSTRFWQNRDSEDKIASRIAPQNRPKIASESRTLTSPIDPYPATGVRDG